jgi:hypothetical protein
MTDNNSTENVAQEPPGAESWSVRFQLPLTGNLPVAGYQNNVKPSGLYLILDRK